MLPFELASVVKRYGSRTALSGASPRLALAGVSLRLGPGEALGLLGPNGAGKTTALRLLLGFARATSGGVTLFGRDPRDPEARRGVGYLPERLVLPERMRVRSFLALHAALAGVAQRERAAEIETVLALVGLAERAHEPIGGLSKGLRQRLGFANALLGRPALLVLDEPTSGLDPLGIRDARGWLQAARARGAALLVSSHGLSEVERTCDRVAILHEGRLAAHGALAELAAPGESLEDVFVRAVRG